MSGAILPLPDSSSVHSTPLNTEKTLPLTGENHPSHVSLTPKYELEGGAKVIKNWNFVGTVKKASVT
jgi:hypothetical protein